MNKRQVILLWVIAIALAAAVTAVKLGRVQETKSATTRTVGQTLLPSFDATAVANIDVHGATESTTLVKKDNKWTVAQREDYPAKTAAVNELLRTFGDLKVAQAMQAGPSFAPRFGMDEASKTEAEHGLIVSFKDAAGKELAKVTIGKNVESTASSMGGPAFGRFVRNHADESGFYAVSELFTSLSDQPKKWLSENFLKAEKIKSIAVTQPGKSDVAWKVLRATEDGEFALEGGGTADTLDPATASAFKTLLGFVQIEDIVPAAEVEKRAVADQNRVATITTFEGITYTLKFTPTQPGSTPAEVNPEDPSAPAEESFLVNVDVSADLATERKKPEGEKPEDAKAADEAFAARSKALTEKVSAEKALATHTFQIGKFTFESLLKDRAGLIKAPEAPAPPSAQGAGPGGLPPFQMPTRPRASATSQPVEATSQPIEATTEPVAAPAPPEEKAPEPAPPAK